jgi:hypothetical protein
MDEEGKKPQKRYHVLVMREKNSKQAAWLRTDGMNYAKMEQEIGRFVMAALRRFRLKCFGIGATPDISLTPLVMSEDAMAALELDTWRCELEEMMKDVERSTEG